MAYFAPLEHRPMLLKDFLREDAAAPPRWSTTALTSKSNKPHIVLLRSWSKRAAATKISAVHKVIKLLHFASMKSSSRSISRKLTKNGKGESDIFGNVSEVKVKVKDILRWRSFRDLAEEDGHPATLDLPPPSPDRSGAATTTASCSERSSWCDSDFTAEELPPWGGENAATLKNSKGDWCLEEYDQQSPVSVLDSPFRQVQEFISPFHPPTSNNVQRSQCNLTRRNRFEEDEEEEKAKQLVRQVSEDEDGVLLDFFANELSINGNFNDDEISRIAKSWLEGEFEDSYEWEVEEKRQNFVKDMERGVCWNKFSEEREILCKELEIRVLNDLIDELVADFLN